MAAPDVKTLEDLLAKARAGGYGPASRELLDRAGVGVQYVTDPGLAAEAVAKLTAADGPLGLDIETAPLPEYAEDKKAGLDPHRSTIRLVQVYAGGAEAFVFDAAALGLEVLAPLWGRPLVAHNAVFELKQLLHAGADPKQLGCTMLQANAQRGGLVSLANRARELLGWDMPKALQTSDWSAPALSEDQLAYAALDAVAVHRLFGLQADQLLERDLDPVYALMRDAQRAIARLELNGVNFDLVAHGELVAAWEKNLRETDLACREVLGVGVSPSSGAQVSGWLEATLPPKALKDWPRTRTGQLKTDANTLVLYGHLPLVKPLLAHKVASKNLSTYGTSYAAHVNPVTGRLHASFYLGGTTTGRLSCARPNIQNPPRDPAFRALFSAPAGRVMVVADYGQIELRVAALVSGDPAMLEAYAKGEDLHRKTAGAVAGVAAEDVTPDQRQMAKAVNFGLLYGQGAKGLAAYARSSYGVDMTLDQAKRARGMFFDTYRGMAIWQRQTARASERSQRAVTPGGRVRDFSIESRGYRYTEALNTPIQGGAAEVLLAALARVEDALTGLDARLVNVVHDELVLEVAEGDAAAAKTAVEQAMAEGFLAVFPDGAAVTRGLVEAKAGPNWAEAK